MTTAGLETDRLGLIASAYSLPQLNSIFKRVAADLGFEHFGGGSLVEHDKPADMFLLDWPESWTRQYLANGYATADPILPRALASPEPFTLQDLLATQAQNPVLDAAVAFGWRRLFVVPIHGPGHRRGVVSLASLRAVNTTENEALAQLKDLAIVAYRRGCALRSARTTTGPLPRRQREVLMLASCGLTDHEIGARLRISSHTAHSHVESAKRRLGARSRAQAIALASSLSRVRTA